MPAAYAHFRLARQIILQLPERLKELTSSYPDLFFAGAQGPDLLFFYKPLKFNGVNKVGYDLHEESGKLFFGNALKIITQNRKRADFKAYALGLLCHYALDKACHGYIENKIAVSNVSHSAIEKEFDKYLMRIDGIEPFGYDLSCGIKKDAADAAAITPFFNDMRDYFKIISVEEVLDALGGFITYNKLMLGRTRMGRAAIFAALKLAGKYEDMRDMFYSRKDIAACEDSNMRLLKLFERAKGDFYALADEFFARAEDGAPPGDSFAPTFGPCDGWQDIPVLSTEEEREYEI